MISVEEISTVIFRSLVLLGRPLPRLFTGWVHEGCVNPLDERTSYLSTCKVPLRILSSLKTQGVSSPYVEF